MTNNTHVKTRVNEWLNHKKPMIPPSIHSSITEADIQSYISYLYEAGHLDNSVGLTVKTIRDVILVLSLTMEYVYKEPIIPLLNWGLIEYPKEFGIKKVTSLKGSETGSYSVHLHEP